MPKFDFKKHTLHLRDGDFDFLATVFAQKQLSPSYVVRTLISEYVDKLKAQLEQQEKETEDE